MAELEDGLWAARYLEPQLLEDFKNYKDDFIGVLKAPNAAAIGKDGIYYNKLINNVDFKINNTEEFTPLAMTGKKGLVEWDKMDTTPTSCTDAELRAMVFDKEDAIRVEHTNTWKIGVRDYVLDKLAPSQNVDNKMPVIITTGANDGTGRKRLTYADLVNYYNRLGLLNLNDPTAWYMVLSDVHNADLIVDRSNTNNYRDIVIDPQTGELKRFFKLQFFQNNNTPYYNASGVKKSLGSTVVATDQKASVFFYAPNTVYHIEGVKVLYKPSNIDTRNADPTSEVRFHAYGLCDRKQEHGVGAIVSGNA